MRVCETDGAYISRGRPNEAECNDTTYGRRGVIESALRVGEHQAGVAGILGDKHFNVPDSDQVIYPVSHLGYEKRRRRS